MKEMKTDEKKNTLHNDRLELELELERFEMEEKCDREIYTEKYIEKIF